MEADHIQPSAPLVETGDSAERAANGAAPPEAAEDSVMKDQERAPEPAKKPRFEIKKWSAVAFWSWDIEIELCAICRNHIMDICVDCQSTENAAAAANCTVSWGACSHVFHSHCISRWLSSRPVCPLDNQPWVLQKCGS